MDAIPELLSSERSMMGSCMQQLRGKMRALNSTVRCSGICSIFSFVILAAMGVASSLALDFLETEAMQQLQRDLRILEYVWPPGGDPCTNWVGVSCANNHVDSIRLTGLPREDHNQTFWQAPPQQLQLAVSALDALRELPYLRELNASGFLLPGVSIPDWFGSALPALVSLDLSSCLLNGSIPNSLGITSLMFLSLANNSLSGTIPPSFASNFTSLTFLDLSSNELVGPLPAIFVAPKLSMLDLSRNNLGDVGTSSGAVGSNLTIFSAAANLQNLVSLNLSANSFSSPFPEGMIASLQLLQVLDISHNYFYGEIPASLQLEKPTSLKSLNLSYNFFNGSLPWCLVIPSAVAKKNCLSNAQNQHTAETCRKFYTQLDSISAQGAAGTSSAGNGSAAVTPAASAAAPDQAPAASAVAAGQKRSTTLKAHLVPIILAGVLGGLGFIIIAAVLLLCCFCMYRRRNFAAGRSSSCMDVSHGGRIRVVGTAAGTGAPAVMISATRMGEMFTLLQLQQATDNFSASNLLANGHSGDLFKGVLEGGTRVVVKRIDLQKMKSMDSYLQELDVLARASHTRLVLLLGTCCCLDSNNSNSNNSNNSNNSSSNEKFLVYKFAPNGDLESALQKKNTFIFPEAVSNAAMQSDSGVQSLDWITRLKIAIGVAEALAYLHFECSPPIAHRDVKASSIFLDDKFEVRLGSLSDARVQDIDSHPSRITRLFGLSQASDHGESGSAAVSSSYDVYSFGKVLLELVSGKQGISRGTDPAAEAWLEWALPLISSHNKDFLPKLVDPTLIVDEDLLDEVWAMAIIARACLHSKASKRPTIRHVLKALENPGKVIRADLLGESSRTRTSSHSSWNEALFGSWRHSNNIGSNLISGGCTGSLREDPKATTFTTTGFMAASTSSAVGDGPGIGRHVRWGSSDIVPEPIDEKTLEEKTNSIRLQV